MSPISNAGQSTADNSGRVLLAALACLTLIVAASCSSPEPAQNVVGVESTEGALEEAQLPIAARSEPSTKKARLFAGAEGAASIDLDPVRQGQVGQPDLTLELSRGSMTVLYLVPQNGAVAIDFGMSVPDRASCEALVSKMVETSIPEIENQRCLCIQTDEGRLVAVRLHDVTYEGLTLEAIALEDGASEDSALD